MYSQKNSEPSPKKTRPVRELPEVETQRWLRNLAVVAVIIAAGLLAYSNSFQGPYILDDVQSIPQNPHIRSLWPIWEAASGPYQQSTVSGRPVLSLSLALNYQISGLDVWSYHTLNMKH